MKIKSLISILCLAFVLSVLATKPQTIYQSILSDGTKIWVTEIVGKVSPMTEAEREDIQKKREAFAKSQGEDYKPFETGWTTDSTSHHYAVYIETHERKSAIVWEKRGKQGTMWLGSKEDQFDFNVNVVDVLDVKSWEGQYSILYRTESCVIFDMVTTDGELVFSSEVCRQGGVRYTDSGRITWMDGSPYVLTQSGNDLELWSIEKEKSSRLGSWKKKKGSLPYPKTNPRLKRLKT